MNTSRYFKLGVFVILGVGLLLAAVLALGADRLLQKRVQAETVMDESVSGLDVGSPVKYRGVMIGHVTSIAFAAEQDGNLHPEHGRIAHYVLIDMELNNSSFRGMSAKEINQTLTQMAKSGLRARLDQQGLGGGVYIGLDFAETAPPPPPPIHDNAQAIYIPSAPSTMNQVMSAADHLAADLRNANLPQMIQHFDGLITNASGAVQHVNQIVETNKPGINSTIADLPTIAKQLKDTTARLDQILHDARVDRTIGNVAADTANAGATINDIHDTVRNLQSVVLSRQDDIQSIVADLRRTADNLAAISGDVRDDPARLLFSQPPPHKALGQ